MSKSKQDKPAAEELTTDELEDVSAAGISTWGDPHEKLIKPRLSPDIESGGRRSVRVPGFRVPGSSVRKL